MTEAEAIKALSLAFTTGWALAQPAVPFAIGNEDGELPTIPPATADRFAYFQVITTTSDNATGGEVGQRLVERRGWVQVKLWVPAGERTEGIGVLIETVRTIFEMQNIAGPGSETIDVFAMSTDTIGTDGRWYMKLARAPYRVYETK